MGCAIKLFKKKEEQKTMVEKRFLILGLDSAGKTTLLQRIVKKELEATGPTVGLNVEQTTYKEMSITLWDVGGSATMLWKHYYENTDALVFVVDSADRERIEEVKTELQRIAEDPSLQAVPLLVLGNKQDLKAAIKGEELQKLIEFEKIDKKLKAFQSCSALENSGVFEGIDKLIELTLHTAI